MEENKDLRDEEIVEEHNSVEENTESTENAEVEEIMEEYSETDDLSMIRKLKDENKKLSNELDALKDRLLRLTAEYDNYSKIKRGYLYRCLHRCIKRVITCGR